MAHPAVYEKLREVARNRETISYGGVARLAGIDMDNPHFATLVGHMLDEINRAEHRAGHPLLSAVVIGLDGNRPGRGFFSCARDLGCFRGGDEDEFWVEELHRVYAHWAGR